MCERSVSNRCERSVSKRSRLHAPAASATRHLSRPDHRYCIPSSANPPLIHLRHLEVQTIEIGHHTITILDVTNYTEVSTLQSEPKIPKRLGTCSAAVVRQRRRSLKSVSQSCSFYFSKDQDFDNMIRGNLACNTFPTEFANKKPHHGLGHRFV